MCFYSFLNLKACRRRKINSISSDSELVSFSFNAATKKLNIFNKGRSFWPGRQEIYMGAGNIGHRVHTEWQLPLSGVHSIMMEKLAQPGEGWQGVHDHSLSLYPPSHTKSWCMLQLRGQIHSLYFCSTLICTL